MKCSLGISNFLEEISSLSHYIVFLYFFALIAEEGFPISPCYSLLYRLLKYWNFSFSISPFNEYSGLIFIRTEWFDLFAIEGTLKSLPRHHNLKVSILWCGPTLTSIHDYWENHSFNHMDLCQLRMSVFQYLFQ